MIEEYSELQMNQWLNDILQQLNDAQRKEEMNYLFTRGHFERIKRMIKQTLPYCHTNSHLVDLGCHLLFPLLVNKMRKIKESDGIMKFEQSPEEVFGSVFDVDDQGKFNFRPVSKDNYRERGKNIEISIPLINIDLSKDRLPYEDNSIDIVTCFEVLEHMPGDPMRLMSEVNRILTDDGIFLLSTPNANSMANILKSINFESPKFYPPYTASGVCIEHVKEYSIREIKKLYDSAGFEIVCLETFNHVDYAHDFNHNEEYQIGFIGQKEDRLQELRLRNQKLEEMLYESVLKTEELKKDRGDYILMKAKKVSNVKERFCFPVYEKSN